MTLTSTATAAEVGEFAIFLFLKLFRKIFVVCESVVIDGGGSVTLTAAVTATTFSFLCQIDDNIVGNSALFAATA